MFKWIKLQKYSFAFLQGLSQPHKRLHSLTDHVPHGYRRKALFEVLIRNNVPLLRATWYIKVNYLNQVCILGQENHIARILLNWVSTNLKLHVLFCRFALHLLIHHLVSMKKLTFHAQNCGQRISLSTCNISWMNLWLEIFLILLCVYGIGLCKLVMAVLRSKNLIPFQRWWMVRSLPCTPNGGIWRGLFIGTMQKEFLSLLWLSIGFLINFRYRCLVVLAGYEGFCANVLVMNIFSFRFGS